MLQTPNLCDILQLVSHYPTYTFLQHLPSLFQKLDCSVAAGSNPTMVSCVKGEPGAPLLQERRGCPHDSHYCPNTPAEHKTMTMTCMVKAH